MKTAVIVHGSCSREEYFSDSFPSPSNSHWLPWLQKQFLKSGYQAFTPEMPESYKPDYALWQREFERCEISDASVLVGHSCGAGFLLRWLSENRVKIKRLVLVAPWLDPESRRTSEFFDFSIAADLSERAEIHLLESLNDFSEIGQSVKHIRNALPVHVYHPFENCGHFCITDPSSPFCEKLAKIAIGRQYSLQQARQADLASMMEIAHEDNKL